MGHRLHREDLLWQLCPRQGRSIDISNIFKQAVCLNGKTKSLKGRVQKFKANNLQFFALQGVNQMRHRIRALQDQAGWRLSASNHASKIISLWWRGKKSVVYRYMVSWLHRGAISLTGLTTLFWFSSTSLHQLLYFLVLSDFNIIVSLFFSSHRLTVTKNDTFWQTRSNVPKMLLTELARKGKTSWIWRISCSLMFSHVDI